MIAARTEPGGSTWSRFPHLDTRSIRGVNASGVSLQFRRSAGLPIRGKRPQGTFDPTAGGAGGLQYKGDIQDAASWPPGGSFVLGDYYYFVSSTGTVGGSPLVRGDCLVYDGVDWVKQSRPAGTLAEGDWWVVAADGNYDRSDNPALVTGDRLVYLGFQSNSGTGKLRFLVETKAGVFFYRGEFDPSGGLPVSPTDGELYSCSAAGSAGGFTLLEDDVMIRESGAWGKLPTEPVQTIANGGYVMLPCYASASEWEVRRTDKTASISPVVLSAGRSTLRRRHADEIVVWGDSMPGKLAVALASALSPRTVTVRSYGGGTSRNVLTMVEREIAKAGDTFAGRVNIFWHGQNNGSDMAQISEVALRAT